ncbi:MAG: hypothetical protein ABI425_01635 [Patescibacteria group bacterium]
MAAQSPPKPITLTQTAAILRNVVKVGFIAIILMMVGRVFFTSLIAYIKSLTPPKQLPPTVGFKQLPKLPFPVQPNVPKSYTLETVGGQLPSFGDRAKVFFMPTAQASLTAVDRAKKKASGLGYLFEPEIIDSRMYRWTLTSPLLATLQMDILTGTFTISTNWSAHPELLTKKQTISSTTLIERVKSTLQQANSLSADVSTGPARTKLVKTIGGQLTEADSLSDADFLEVDLYRKPVDEKYSSVTARGKQGPVHALVASDGTILEMIQNVYPVEYQIVETYPLLSPDLAWKTLSAGAGYVAQKGTSDTATIRTMSLAYFEPDEETPYYRPVYVFESKEGFVGMVDAIDPIWIQK